MQQTDRLSLLEFYGELRNQCRAAGGQSRFAEKHGLSPSYISDVANARREPGGRLLAAMGLRKIVAFERVKVPQ